MNKTEFLSKLADVLQMDVTEVTEDLAFSADIWDSFTQLGAISVIDEVYGITVAANELKDCRTVGDLLSLIESNPASA